MTDRLIRALSADGRVRVFGISITQSLNEAHRRHGLSPTSTAALGRAMSASLLLAANMKRNQARVNVRVSGDGGLGLVYADAGFDGTVRGFVSNPNFTLPPLEDGHQNVSQAVGQVGFLKVMRDIGYGEPYSSTVELVAGDIANDVAWYLASSEQTYSKLILTEVIDPQEDAPVKFAAGILLQIMPMATLRAAKTANRSQEDLIHQLEDCGDRQKLNDLLGQGKEIADVMLELFAEMQLDILPLTKEVKFSCPCSFDRMLAAMKMFGEEDLQAMIMEDKGAEATCHFCGEVYQATTDHLKTLLTELRIETKA
ncbi:MAG: Hsp33 family molecular chaperone HslO [Pseudanabaena sp.]|nr:MAG: Hsp33 family molecular chaperone HslO [Pseudanabaena sp.]